MPKPCQFIPSSPYQQNGYLLMPTMVYAAAPNSAVD